MADVSQSQVKLFSDSVEISLGYEPTPGKLVLGVIQGRGVSQGRGRGTIVFYAYSSFGVNSKLLTSPSNF